MDKITVRILFGELEVNDYLMNNRPLKELMYNVDEFTFESIAEKEAFLKGMNVANGWQRYLLIEENKVRS